MAKTIINEAKGNWKLRKIFVIYITDKELISLISKEQVKIQEKETDQKSTGKMDKRYEQTIHKMI